MDEMPVCVLACSKPPSEFQHFFRVLSPFVEKGGGYQVSLITLLLPSTPQSPLCNQAGTNKGLERVRPPLTQFPFFFPFLTFCSFFDKGVSAEERATTLSSPSHPCFKLENIHTLQKLF